MSTTSPAAEATAEALTEHPESGHGRVPATFEERYDRALANARLSRNLTAFQQFWWGARGRAVAEVDFDRLRSDLKAAKTRVTDDLDGHLARFQAAAERAG